MSLANQLRQIAEQARGNAASTTAANQAQTGIQTQQAIAAGAAQPAGGTKQGAQQLAAGITAQSQQQNLQTQAGLAGQLLGAGQQALQAKTFGQQSALAEQQQLNTSQINDMQRQGLLRQNSEQLRSAKQLQKAELDAQKRLASKAIEHDNRLSFLTRKQREDLAKLDGYLKNQIFDNRMAFSYNNAGRRFADQRQLADYMVLSAKNEEQLRNQLREMTQAAQRSQQVLQHAHNMLTERLKMEFKRAESQKDQALLLELEKRKQALEKKMARKRAKASATNSMIVGAFTIAGAVAGSFIPGGTVAGATLGASVGAGVGQAVAGQQGAQ